MERSTDVNNIRNQLLNLFLPTHEAAVVALTNVFFNLAGNPRGYEKFGFKILRTGEDQAEWTSERLKSLKYLQHVVNETFRPNPAIGTNTGMVLRDTSLPTIGGLTASKSSPVFVRKDDTVTTSFCTSHRRQDLFRENATVATRTLGQLECATVELPGFWRRCSCVP